jgi:hypothetical protein
MNIVVNSRRFGIVALCGAILFWVAPGVANDQPGYVDPKAFLELAGDDNLDVEVTIGPAMVRLMSSAIRESEPDLHEALSGLAGLYTAIIDVSDETLRTRSDTLVRDTIARLEKGGWERLARVRDESSNLNVLVHGLNEETIDGLLVLILDKSDETVVFVNLHGKIDLAHLQAIAEQMDVPGLDEIGR